MSSTNRGAVREDRDFYKTPRKAFEPLIPFISRPVGLDVWEPACGDRRLIDWMQESGINAAGVDISDGEEFDFISDRTQRECIVTNPPFSLAFEFCQRAVQNSPHVFMLLRLNFLASKKRMAWFKQNEPSALFILSSRPSFTDDSKTDSCDYAWYYWGSHHKGIIHL